MPPKKCCWTKACAGNYHSHRRSCLQSEFIPPRWFCEPRLRKFVMSPLPPHPQSQDPPCKCNPPESRGNCSCHQGQDCPCCSNTSCDEKQPCKEPQPLPSSRRVLKSAPTPLAYEDSVSNTDIYPCKTCQGITDVEVVDDPMPYPCKTCPAEAAKLAANNGSSFPTITCSKECMQSSQPSNSDQLFQDSQFSAKIQTDDEFSPCITCPDKQTSTPKANEAVSCGAKKSASKQNDKQCPETCLSKIAASTSCENWTEMVRDLVRENIKSLLDVQCDCAPKCTMNKSDSRRNSKDAPAATNSIETCEQATHVTVGRVESKTGMAPEKCNVTTVKNTEHTAGESACTMDCRNRDVCKCCYPPAYKKIGCTGFITGTCECEKNC